MKASDFTTTSSQRDAASQTLLQTEQTDAVNSGIVGKADKSGSTLKGNLYSVGKKAATGGAASAALSAVTNGRKGKPGAASASALASQGVHEALAGSELEGADDLYHGVKGTYRAGKALRARLSGKGKPTDFKASAKSVGKIAARGAVSSAIDGTELEGADTVYDVSKASYHAVQGAKRRLAKGRSSVDGKTAAARSGSKNPLASEKPLGKLSEKKSAMKAANTVEAKRKAQAAGYFKRNVYTVAEKAKSTAATAKGGLKLLSGGAGNPLSALAGIASPLSLLLFGFLALLLLLAILAGAAGGGAKNEQDNSTGSLSGVPLEVATALKGYGYTNEGIAAILGNMQQESSMNPGTAGDDGYGTASVGLIQLSGSNKNDFLRWCANNGKTWYSVSAQMEWSFSGEPGTGYFIEDWYDGLATTYYELEDGYEARFGRDYYRSGEEMKTSTDVDLATYSFMACHERCGSRKDYGDDVSRLDKRLEYARNFLAQLNSGSNSFVGGEEYDSAEPWQRAIVDACYTTPDPGAGLCATWVSNVYKKAGVAQHGGNGNSMLEGNATSTDWEHIKIGQIVSAQYGSNTTAGNTYGHVAIYVGNGMVMDSIGYIRTISLDQWRADYGRGWVVYGWPF